MTRKRLILAAALVAFTCLLLGVLVALPPRSGVTKANYDRIGIGMSYWDEIESILGKPGDSTTGPYAFDVQRHIESAPNIKIDHHVSPFHAVPGRRVWIGDEGIIIIYFDSKDKVVYKSFCDVEPVSPSFYQRLRRMTGI
jgi:hypothetical protein